MTRQYTKRERQMFVRQLKKARPLVEGSRFMFVCWALEISCTRTSSAKIRNIACERLNGHATVHSWMCRKHPKVAEKLYENNQWQEYRLAWIDNMIEEFSK